MSSFICSAKHFKSIEETIFNLIRSGGGFVPYSLKEDFEVLYNQRDYTDEPVLESIRDVINSLKELNVLCVSLQYKHHYEGFLDKEIEEQKVYVNLDEGFKLLTKRGLYNALRCVSYQIEKEHLEEIGGFTDSHRKALLFLDEMVNLLAYIIISEIKQEDPTCNWEVK
jgi:hypothetical protein